MLTKEQRDSIMKLYGEDVNISTIARKVGVSRHSVYRVIQSDIEEDAEVHALKKRLKKAKLQKSIREERRPFLTESKLDGFERVLDRLISKVQALWAVSPEFKNRPQYCPYCGAKVEYHETEDAEGFFPEYVCQRCRKIFPFP